MRPTYPLFQSHLDLAHDYWRRLVTSSDIVVDATCGNGYDSAFLLTLQPTKLIVFDIQDIALHATKKRIDTISHASTVTYHQMCHSKIDEVAARESVKLIVYNLGYLPGGNKTITTMTSTTLESIQSAIHCVQQGGAICITCYPGHPEGAEEEQALLEFCKTLSSEKWNVSYHAHINRTRAPTLIFLQKTCTVERQLLTSPLVVEELRNS